MVSRSNAERGLFRLALKGDVTVIAEAVAADARANGIPVDHLQTSLIPGRHGVEDPLALIRIYNIASNEAKSKFAIENSRAIPMIRR